MRSHSWIFGLALAAALLAPAAGESQIHGGGGHGGHGGVARGGAPAVGGGHFADARGAWIAHPGFRGGAEHLQQWGGGHWWRGNYGGHFGSWWIVGPDWYWYPTEVAAVPDPYTPPYQTPGYWYWCDTYQQYYPYVGACPSGWRAVTPQ
ncbi:MAG: hypothetical protein JO267_10510 [Alphaproteobacteria bacterium]|nr:hypothetical protein [Alphaproteobacteria bacterium]